MKTRRWILPLAVVLGFILVFGGAVNALEIRDGKKILVFGMRQAAPNIDPGQKYDYSTRMIQNLLYDALLKYVGNPPRAINWLAESYESTPDGKVWTFHLVKNAKFHNGDPVTAEAVKFSFQRTLKLNKGPAWMLKAVLNPDGIKVVDDYTIKFTLIKPYSPFPAVLPWWYIVNPKVVMANEKDGDMGQEWMQTNSAGSGAFRQRRWEHGVLYELEAVEDYWRGWPNKNHVDGVIFKLIRESSSQRMSIQKGECDIVEGLSPEEFDLVAKYPGIWVSNDPGLTAFGIKMNNQKGYTKDINLRKAICYAFDYDALIKIYNGNAILMDSPFPHGIKGHIKTDMYRQDLEKAKEYLKKSAYPNGGIELEYVYVQGLEAERKMGLVLIDNLAKLNIKVKMVPLTWVNMKARGSKVETSPNMMAIFVTPAFNDPDAIAFQYHKDSWGRYYGTSHYNNPEVWKLTEETRTIVDWEKRAPIYEKIQKMILNDAPEIFGMQYNRRWAFRDYVKGFEFCPLRFTGEIDLYPIYIEK
ncbi:MAG: ABC transporter substrate-binding protein [Deltaproteobacteria bacterium]|nr:ABC transporter substrate-binding protein [Deltaproteobacteria bacterium]MBW1993706.1 ABC transporter substrate-binding protein [Deltaproteobacteria bacterium]MBW2152893.1 ABC transporter substrate-binding protein [Deltaproteobacteria bacterium]